MYHQICAAASIHCNKKIAMHIYLIFIMTFLNQYKRKSLLLMSLLCCFFFIKCTYMRGDKLNKRTWKKMKQMKKRDVSIKEIKQYVLKWLHTLMLRSTLCEPLICVLLHGWCVRLVIILLSFAKIASCVRFETRRELQK